MAIELKDYTVSVVINACRPRLCQLTVFIIVEFTAVAPSADAWM